MSGCRCKFHPQPPRHGVDSTWNYFQFEVSDLYVSDTISDSVPEERDM